LDFTNKDGTYKPFVFFMGDNGSGKSTVLQALQLLFTRFEGYDPSRVQQLLSKCVRHIDYNKISLNDDFLVGADVSSEYGDYSIQINKNGFVMDHPKELKALVYRLCYYTRFDQELDKFQRMNPQGAEYSVQLNYLDLLLDLPWGVYSVDDLDLKRAAEILERDHYGLEKVKQRIFYGLILKRQV
jgi:energy-coupling factor transporter ATP-binding protein EcfA2